MWIYRNKASLLEGTVFLKSVRLIVITFGFTAFAYGTEPPGQQNTAPLHHSKNHAPAATAISEQNFKKPPISSLISDAFNQKIQRNLNLLLNAKLASGNTEPFTNTAYFQQKAKNQQTFVSPTVGFRYHLTSRLSLSAETELGYFKFSDEKWYDLNYHPPEELLKDNSFVLFHTDAGLKFRF